jgi:hypothetical protein
VLKKIVNLFAKLNQQLRALARRRESRRPTFPLFNSGKPGLWRHPDEELLKGFGER